MFCAAGNIARGVTISNNPFCICFAVSFADKSADIRTATGICLHIYRHIGSAVCDFRCFSQFTNQSADRPLTGFFRNAAGYTALVDELRSIQCTYKPADLVCSSINVARCAHIHSQTCHMTIFNGSG